MPEKDERSQFMPDEIPFGEVVKRAAPLMKLEGVEAGEPLEEGCAQLVLFNGKKIRQVFHGGEWRFSIVDVIRAIVETEKPSRYWSELKTQLSETEGFDELFGKIEQLKMEGADGKMYPTEAVNVETLMRIIQSIPSKKAEPFKRWLAKVGYERIQETHDPEISVKRAILNWQVQGRTNEWIEARLRSIVIRKELTDEWKDRGIVGQQYGHLTGIIAQETFGILPSAHSKLKGLGNHNLRDHMTDLELVFTMLGEKSTTAIAQATDAQGLVPNARAARSGGKVAGDARKGLENKLGKSVVSPSNFLGRPDREPGNLPSKQLRIPKGVDLRED